MIQRLLPTCLLLAGCSAPAMLTVPPSGLPAASAPITPVPMPIAAFGPAGLPPTPAPSVYAWPSVPPPAPFPLVSAVPTPAPPPAIAGQPLPVGASRIATYLPAHVLIPFSSNRLTGGVGGFDIYIYDRSNQTVLVLPGANTTGDEFNPSLSNNNRWLVYSSTASGNADIRLYDMQTQLVDTLRDANTPGDDVDPTIDAAGDLIAYTSHERGRDRLHLYDVRNGANYIPAVVDKLGTTINNPFISVDGTIVAFSTPVPNRGLDIFFYDVRHATVSQPPFLNTEATEDEPCLFPDNQRVLFSTNRRGNEDIMLLDLRTGFTDPLPLANTLCSETTPICIGPNMDQILFLSDRTGPDNRQMYIYQPGPHILDTVPVSHFLGKIDTFSPP